MSATIFKEEDPMVKECYQILGNFWYVITNDNGYCFGLVDFIETELGYFSLDEVLAAGAVKDPCFQPAPLSEVMGRVERIHAIEGIA